MVRSRAVDDYIPTVKVIKERRKLRNKNNEIDTLVWMVKMVTTEGCISDDWRHLLSMRLSTIGDCCSRCSRRRFANSTFIKLNSIIATTWRRLPLEHNKEIRSNLLQFLNSLIDLRPFFYCTNTRDSKAILTILDVLEQHLSTIEREKAFDVLLEILTWNGSDGTGHRIVGMCLGHIHVHLKKKRLSSVILTRMIRCLRIGIIEIYPSESIDDLLRDEYFFSLLFDILADGIDGKFYRDFSMLFTSILEYAPEADRVAIVIRYYPRLVDALEHLPIRNFVDFICHKEFAALVATSETFLDNLFDAMHHDCERDHGIDCWTRYEYDDMCSIAIHLLNFAVQLTDADELLEELLGLNLLRASHHFANNKYDHNNRRIQTYRLILEAHPEFKASFREWTIQGPRGNLTADFGRSIPHAETVEGDYFLTDEPMEDEDFNDSNDI